MAFCTNCGNPLKEGHRFCGKCGTPIGGTPATENTSVSGQDWRGLLAYHEVLSAPDVQRALQIAAKRSSDNLTAKEITALLSPVLPGAGQSILGVVSKVGYSIAASDSVLSASRESARDYAAPPGVVIGALACAFAARSYDVQDVQEAGPAVEITARVPVGAISAQFLVEATVTAPGDGTHIAFALRSVGWKIFKWKAESFHKDLDAEMARYITELSR